MSPIVCANHNNKGTNQKPRSRSNQTKRVDHTKEFSSHQPSPSPLPDEDFHPPHKAAAEECPELEIISPCIVAGTESAKKQSSSTVCNDAYHVTRTKAATTPRLRHHMPYRRSACLEHMSVVNCTADCFNAEPLAEAMTPPPAPLPPRLPTPELSDVEEDAFWSCCRSSKSSKCSNLSNDRTDDTDKDGSLWNEMGKRPRP